MGFELFTAQKSRGYEPKISIRSRGQIAFNVGAIIRYDIMSYRYAQLYYDAEAYMIGINLTNNEQSEGKVKISKRKDGSAWLSAKSFFNYFNIPLPEKGSEQPEIETFNNMIVLKYPSIIEENMKLFQ